MYIEKWDTEVKKAVSNMSQKEKDRLSAIIAMHVMVCDMNDENAYMEWIYVVPDGANEWDFIDFALNDEGTEENELFNEAVKLFKKLWQEYAAKDKGLYIGGKTY